VLPLLPPSTEISLVHAPDWFRDGVSTRMTEAK
jgi:hypothetical protein